MEKALKQQGRKGLVGYTTLEIRLARIVVVDDCYLPDYFEGNEIGGAGKIEQLKYREVVWEIDESPVLKLEAFEQRGSHDFLGQYP